MNQLQSEKEMEKATSQKMTISLNQGKASSVSQD